MNLLDLFVKISVDDQASSQVETLSGKLKSGLANAAKVGAAAVAAVGGGIAALGTYAAKVGGDFEAQMSKVSAISGATGDDLQALEDKAKQLGIDTKFSATEAGQAFEYMAMAGWKTEQMLDGVAGVMDLAAASGEDLASVSDIVTDAMTAFGLSAENSTHFADVLAKASSNANTNVGLMGETFKYVAPVAGAMGFSVEDTATAIGLMANAGIKGSQAGTALRAMLSRLANPTDEVEAAMTKLNLSITNSDGSMRELDEIMADLRNGFDGFTEAEQTQIATQLAGQEAMSGLLAIVNTSEAEYNKLADAVNNADGAAKNMAATMANNLQGQLTLLKSSAEGFGLALYDKIKVPLTEMASWAVDSLNQLTTAFNENGVSGMIEAAGEIVGSAIGEFTNALPQFASTAVEIVKSLVNGIKDNLPQIAEGAVTTVDTLANGIAERIPELIPTIVDVVIQIVETLIDNVDMLVDAALEIILALTDGLIESLPKLIEEIPGLVIKIVDAIIENAPKLLESAAEIIAKLTSGLIEGFGEIAIKVGGWLYDNIVQPIIDKVSDFKDAGKQLLEGLWNGISDKVAWLREKVSGVVDTIKGWFTGKDGFDEHSPSKWSKQVFRYVMEGGGEGLDAGLPGLMQSVGSVTDRVKSGLDFGTASVDFVSSGRGMSSASIGSKSYGGSIYNPDPITIIVQSVLDGKIIGETAYKYNRQMQRAMGV